MSRKRREVKIGEMFGYWKVLEVPESGQILLGLCTGCGIQKIIARSSLFSGSTKSCGCQKWQRRRETCLEKYGVDHFSKTDEYKKKYKEACLEKFGVEYSLQSEDVQRKAQATLLEKYGVENASQSAEVRAKKRETSLLKYGTEHPHQSEKIKLQKQETNLKNRGVENPSQCVLVQNKIKQTNLEKYGVEYYVQSEAFKTQAKETLMQNYGVYSPTQSEEVRQRIRQTNLGKYGVEFPLGAWVENNPSKSNGEISIIKYLEAQGIPYEREYTFENCRNEMMLPFDFYLPTLNLLIEYDGEHHFKPVKFGGISEERAKENLQQRKRLDLIKTDFATHNNICLLRIPYTEKDIYQKIQDVIAICKERGENNA